MTNCRPKLTIFDLDKTLALCNVSFAFGRYLYKNKQLAFWHMLILVCAYFLHKFQILSIFSLHKIADHFIFLKKSKAEIDWHVKNFIEQNKTTLFRKEIIERLERAKKENSIIWIQSSSPIYLVMPIALFFEVALVTASRHNLVVDGNEKKLQLIDYAEKNNISLDEVTVYSDSILDLALLQAVGHPIAVSPDRKLKKFAHKHSWQVLHV